MYATMDSEISSKLISLMDPQPSNSSENKAQNEALTRQQIQILFSDIEQLRTVHQLYTESPNEAQFSILYRRVTQYLSQMDELSTSIVLEAEQLEKFQQDKQFLNRLSFELAGSSSNFIGELPSLGEFGNPFFGRHHYGPKGHHHGHHGHHGHHKCKKGDKHRFGPF